MAVPASTPDQAHARVLVVDDEESITQLVSTVLRYEGFDVRTAESGRTAVKIARDFAPDLVVLDVMLPDLDGFEVYRRLADRSDRLPVLFLTARDSHRGSRARAHTGRRRLHGQAVQPGGAGGTRARRPAPHPARQPGERRCCASPICSWTRTRARCAAGIAGSS